MNHRGTINFHDFVVVALRGIRFSSKSRHRLVDGFDVPPQDYYNWGPVPELFQENKEMYIHDAKIALTYFTTKGIIKEWYEDVQNATHIDTMSWDTPLSVIYQTTSHHCVETKIDDLRIDEITNTAVSANEGTSNVSYQNFVEQHENWKHHSFAKLEALVSSIGKALLNPEEYEKNAEYVCYLQCLKDVIHILTLLIRSDIGKIGNCGRIEINDILIVTPGTRFCLYKKALLFRFVNSVMNYAHLPQRIRMIQELICYIEQNVTRQSLMNIRDYNSEFFRFKMIDHFKTLDGFAIIIQELNHPISLVIESYALGYMLSIESRIKRILQELWTF